MYPPLMRLFARLDTTVVEVPYFGKHIDLIFASRSLLSLHAVETKLRDWRIGLKQAALNQVAAQLSYVAVPASLGMRLLIRERDIFLKYDVGLIAVNETAKVLLPARRNSCFSLRHYRVLKETLSKAQRKKPEEIGVVADAIAERKKTMVVLQTGAY
jgi:hypothetical protein